MKSDEYELYVSKDIIQKESVPFYLIWKSDNIVSITFEFSGFKDIIEYDNLIDNIIIENFTIKSEYLKSKNYVGGLLKTELSNNPYQTGSLKAIITIKSGERVILWEERILYSTSLKVVNIPPTIRWPIDNVPFEIELYGQTTIFIDLESIEDSEIKLEYPPEVVKAFMRFRSALIESLQQLLPKYPEYELFINTFIKKLENPKQATEKQFFDQANIDLEKIKQNQDFINDFGAAMMYSIQSHSSIKEVIFKPFIEYIDAFATTKCYFESPFLCINVNKGKSTLKLNLKHKGIIEKEGIVQNNSVSKLNQIITEIYAEEPCMIPIRNLFSFRRVNNDHH